MGDEIVILDPKTRKPKTVKPVAFSELRIRERQDLEEWITANPDVLGSKLLIITSEYDKFDKSEKRLDILALDEEGKLVVIELKRDAAKSLADLQAIRYAVLCSRMTFEQVVQLRAQYANVDQETARQEIREFVGDPEFSALDNKPRIILAAGSFDDEELTSCVLWLRSFQVEISCVEITAYRLPEDGRIALVPRTIIPLPEAEDYIVKTELKEAEESSLTPRQRLYRERLAEILRYFRPLMPDRTPRLPWANRYVQIPTGHGGVHFEWWLHGRGDDQLIDVAIHFETPSKERNHALCEYVAKHVKDVTAAVGETPTIEPEWGEKWSSIYFRKTCLHWNEEIAKWAAETMHRFLSVVQPLVDENYASR